MSKSSSQEIESQYNFIKTLLSDPEKYNDVFKKISESWSKDSIDSGKMERCAVVCGQDLDILKNQANKIFRYESYKQ